MWIEIYKKYKDTELMKEFIIESKIYLYGGEIKIRNANIKDLWGHLICFAEMKGIIIDITIRESYRKVGLFWDMNKNVSLSSHYNPPKEQKRWEQSMLWCANKFFEIGV